MYRIMYESETSRQSHNGRGRCVILTAVMFIVFYMTVCIFWPEGKALMQMLIVPGHPETTLQAAEVFAAELGSGYALSDAVRNFCSTVFENGYSG